MGKIILLNGPPSSGKDTAARHILEYLSGEPQAANSAMLDRMSMPIKRAFAGFMGASCTESGIVQPYEATKEQIIPALGVSYRQWQIDFSEKLVKPNYGQECFAKLLVARCQRRFSKNIADLIVIPDCGFQVEIDVLYREFDPKDILLIRCHRNGFDFSKDSRQYVRAPKGEAVAAGLNDSTVEIFEKWVEFAVRTWLASPLDIPREE